jgi:hypothetical protein
VIHHWDVSGVPPLHADGLFPCFKRHLTERAWVLKADTVLIEKQPDKNRGIKSVENFLHAYFVIHDKEVIIYDARHKIPDVAGPGRARYLERKKASIDRARAFISATDSVNKHWVSFFDKHKKKDDLADTCMQALSFIDRQPETPTVEKKPKPRKPTENQTRTQYSRANLAWLYTKGEHKNKRFDKDLARYYHSLDELLTEFCLVPK